MTDGAPPPTTSWLTILQGFLPSLNASIIAIVSAFVTLGSTLAMQKWAAPKAAPMVIPAADKPVLSQTDKQLQAAMVLLQQIDGRLHEMGGTIGLCTEEVQALRKDWRTPKVVIKPKAAAVK